jgi:hypothetical protein
VEVSVSQTAEGVVSNSGLSPWTRVALAAPGAAAAALVIVGGVYLAVIGFSDLASMPAEDDFASISTVAALAGVVACALGLLLVAATIIVSLARPRPVLLVLTALSGSVCTSCAAYLLATGASVIVYASLAAVFAYLAAVAVLRLVAMRRATNAEQADQADSTNGFRSILKGKRSQLIRGALAAPTPRVSADVSSPFTYNATRYTMAS